MLQGHNRRLDDAPTGNIEPAILAFTGGDEQVVVRPVRQNTRRADEERVELTLHQMIPK